MKAKEWEEKRAKKKVLAWHSFLIFAGRKRGGGSG
jgi:hypothetical protein